LSRTSEGETNLFPALPPVSSQAGQRRHRAEPGSPARSSQGQRRHPELRTSPPCLVFDVPSSSRALTKAGSLSVRWAGEASRFSQERGDPGATPLPENLSSSPASLSASPLTMRPNRSHHTATRCPLPKVLPTHLSVTASATVLGLQGLPPPSPSHPHPGPLALDPRPRATEGCEPSLWSPLLIADRGALLVCDLPGAKQLTEHQAREPGRTEAPLPVLRLIPTAEPHSD